MTSLTYLQGYPEHLLAQVRMITPLTKRYITILRN